jgi:hypothetical protein
VQGTARRLAEVDGQQYQGNADEQPEYCSSPANLLVMHVMRVSKTLLRANSVLGLKTYYRRRRFREFLLDRWIASNSSNDLPEPTATQVSGDSARCAGICVS